MTFKLLSRYVSVIISADTLSSNDLLGSILLNGLLMTHQGSRKARSIPSMREHLINNSSRSLNISRIIQWTQYLAARIKLHDALGRIRGHRAFICGAIKLIPNRIGHPLWCPSRTPIINDLLSRWEPVVIQTTSNKISKEPSDLNQHTY